MTQNNNNKYSALKALSFCKRSDADKERAYIRPTTPDIAIEHNLLWGDNPGFELDIESITSNPVYKRLGDMGQLAPSFSHVFQNRLTHTNHVSRVAEKLCKAMDLGEESINLSRAIAYAHDIGHAPFSHEAEEVFDDKLKACGGTWDHDYYGMRILTDRAQSLLDSDGLPLSVAVLEGTLKRYQRFSDEEVEADDIFYARMSEVPDRIKKIEREQGLFRLEKWSHIEGQIVAISDWIAGTSSDLRDLLLWELEHAKDDMGAFAANADSIVSDLPLAKKKWDELQALIPENDSHDMYKQNKAIRIFSKMLEKELVEDVLDTTLAAYEKNKSHITNAEDVRDLDELLVQFSSPIMQQMMSLKAAHSAKIYPKIVREHVNTKEIMRAFFELVEASFKGNGNLNISEDWKHLYETVESINPQDERTDRSKMHIVIDYISSGFTDKDVMHLMKTHQPETYADLTNSAKVGIYPMHMPPPTQVWTKTLNLPNSMDGTQERS